MRRLAAGGMLGMAMLAVPPAAQAQARDCRVPAVLPRPAIDGPDAGQPRRDIPTGGYTLAMSWSPQYCRTRTNSPADRFQCGDGGDRFGFTLHGLWPDGRGEQWPQYCRPAALLPEKVIRANLCATPSVQLLQHEYAKHGTCMNMPPEAYFRTSTGLYGKLRFPDMAALSRQPGLNARKLAEALAAANRGTDASMWRIATTRGGWLDEVRLCLDMGLKPKRCRASEQGAKPKETVRIWRGGRR
ncbi:ribonuclease T2 family protein [Sphingomonas sp. MM-1]|uniref:ribonuclease T2 family protein n=1 Tax=Sphingomonas sp. MM-1 TaxID=745310 RepID=UPI000A73808F|nr:ribonuclease T [Sphingomonas sp. MM-1]